MNLKYALKFMFFLFCVITTFQVIFVGALNMMLGIDFIMATRDIM